MNNIEMLSEEQLDFLREMMNIGAGNAATALSQILGSMVDLVIPKVHILPAPKTVSLFDEPSLLVACVRMGMVGDISGSIFFIVSEAQKAAFIQMIKQAMPQPETQIQDLDSSVLMEIGNITAGVYLGAIQDFCKLKIFHFVPTLATDMIQSLLDESLATLSREVENIILIENIFITDVGKVRTFLLLVPSASSIVKLVSSIEDARMAYA